MAVSDASFEGSVGACHSQAEGPDSQDGRVCWLLAPQRSPCPPPHAFIQRLVTAESVVWYW